MGVLADRIDGISTSVAIKAPVRVATTVALDLAGLPTVDGVTVAVGDRVLAMGQADTTQNGIYDVNALSWLRSKDFDGARDVVKGTLVIVNEGAAFAQAVFKVTSANPVLFGTSTLTFVPVNTFTDFNDVSITPYGALTASPLTRLLGRVLYATDFGCIGDGSTNDVVAAQAAQDYCSANKVKLIFNAGLNFKFAAPFYYDSDADIDFPTTMTHGFTGGDQGLICGRNTVTDGGARQTNVRLDFTGGNITFDTRVTPSRKGLIVSFTDNFVVKGLNTVGTDLGSYNCHFRDCNNGRIEDFYINAGDSTGEDGIHLSRNCTNLVFDNCIIFSGDDSFSITHEGFTSAAYIINNIQLNNCILKSKQNSGFKLLIDTNASGAKISDIKVNNTMIGVHDGSGTLGGGISIFGPSTDVAGISRVQFANTSTDTANGLFGGNSNLVRNATAVDLGNMQIFNTNSRGVLFQNVRDCSIGPDYRVSDPSVTLLASGVVTSVVWVSGSTVQATFAPGTDLSGITGFSNYAIIISGCANASNNGRFIGSAFDNTAKTVNFSVDANTRGSATDDETGITAAGTVNRTTLEALSISGGDNIKILHGTVDNPGTSGLRISQESSVSATNVLVLGNTFKNCNGTYGMDLAGVKNSVFQGNKMLNSGCRQFIVESNSSINENNKFIDNDDTDTVHSKTSYQIARATAIDRNNRGTNPSKVVGTGTVLAAGTTTTIVLTALTFSKAFASANMSVKDLRVIPTASFGTAKNFWVTLSSRTYTIHLDAAPGADWTFDYVLDASGSST